jgi:ATP synthase protein I
MSSDPFSHTVLGRANASMEDNLTASGPTIFTGYGMIGAILFFGGVGYLLDRWIGTTPWLLLTGFMIGIGVGFSGLYRLVRRR